jgi:hypothetical protein
MYPEKLSQKIWEFLREAGLVREGGYEFTRDFALVLMGQIADICAGGTREKITNYVDAHDALTRLTAAQNEPVQDFKPDTESAYTTLTTISLKSVDVGKISLSKLVALRKREAEDGLLPLLRANFHKEVELYVKRLKTEVKTKNDVDQIEREFERAMRNDFRNLEAMLELESGALVFTKAVKALMDLVSFNLPAIFGSVADGLPTFKLKKQLVLEKHSTAWLYVAGRSKG